MTPTPSSPCTANRLGHKCNLIALLSSTAFLQSLATSAYFLTSMLFASWTLIGNELRAQTPNIILILADDLGYSELGCYGQTEIETPRLDQMSREGLRFTQFYSGSTVCAPARCSLMTGKHTGHATVRGNATNRRLQSLSAEELTIAEVAKKAGYRTAAVGKWGIGDLEDPGFPLLKGFDTFYGYLDQTHAHNYYPEFLYRDRERESLRNVVDRLPGKPESYLGGVATKKIDYSHDLLTDEATRWLKNHHQNPFFLYLSFTVPHANNQATSMRGNGAEVPELGQYAEKGWPEPNKGHAAMISRMDRDVGRILDLLRELGIAENTLVLFTSDNGPHDESNHDLEIFDPAGPLRGLKRDLLEGGIRVPLIAWWPGTIQENRTTDFVGYGPDILPTIESLLDLPTTELDGLSMVPTLKGSGEQQQHEFLYWEFYEQGSRQSVRFGDWTAIREPMFHGPVQLYDLANDPEQLQNCADSHPDLVQRAIHYMDQSHVPDPNWHFPQ